MCEVSEFTAAADRRGLQVHVHLTNDKGDLVRCAVLTAPPFRDDPVMAFRNGLEMLQGWDSKRPTLTVLPSGE